MFAPARGRVLGASSSVVALPSFLVPAFQGTTTATPNSPAAVRNFSATTSRPSKLGRLPISIPPGVELVIGEPVVQRDPTNWREIAKRTVTVTGPLGSLDLKIPPFINVDHDTARSRVTLSIEDQNAREQKEMWGTTWSYLERYISGVSEGHTAVLRLVGIGYRATIDTRPALETYPGQQFVCLKLGFSHPVDLGVPKGVKASAPSPTRILLEGIDKEVIHSFAAKIRQWRRPEPYKGKGIFVNDETIKLKQKKIK